MSEREVSMNEEVIEEDESHNEPNYGVVVEEQSNEYSPSPNQQQEFSREEQFYHPSYGVSTGPLFDPDYDQEMRSRIKSHLTQAKTINTPHINEKSRKLAEAKRTTNATVHERLHQQALQKQKVKKREQDKLFIPERYEASSIAPKKKTKTHKKSNSSCRGINHGLRLYQKGLKKMEDHDRKHREALMRKNAEEEANLTFQPQINPIS